MLRTILLILVLMLQGCFPATPADESIYINVTESGELLYKKSSTELSEVSNRVATLENEGKKVEIIISSSSANKEQVQQAINRIRNTDGLQDLSIVTILHSR